MCAFGLAEVHERGLKYFKLLELKFFLGVAGRNFRGRTDQREIRRQVIFMYVIQFLLTNKVLRNKKGWTDRGLSLYIYIYIQLYFILGLSHYL